MAYGGRKLIVVAWFCPDAHVAHAHLICLKGIRLCRTSWLSQSSQMSLPTATEQNFTAGNMHNDLVPYTHTMSIG